MNMNDFQLYSFLFMKFFVPKTRKSINHHVDPIDMAIEDTVVVGNRYVYHFQNHKFSKKN